jgi:hypothetical protein
MTSTDVTTETSTAYTKSDVAFALGNEMYGPKVDLTFTGRDGDKSLTVRVTPSEIRIPGVDKTFYGAKAAAPVVAAMLRGA